jgi:hypothetical protein
MKEDCLCRIFGPKTQTFGEWVLWAETAKQVRWGIARAEKIGTNVAFCNEEKGLERTCKPSSVPWGRNPSGDGHFSRAAIARRLKQSTRKS